MRQSLRPQQIRTSTTSTRLTESHGALSKPVAWAERFRIGLFALFVVFGAISILSCRGKPGSRSDPASDSKLESLVVRDDTKDLLLTWADATGDFHVAEAIDQVPADARERVRVVVTSRPDGTQDLVRVADLRQKNADGSYPVSTMTRTAWEELGAAKRKARLEALAPIPSQLPPEPSAQNRAEEAFVAVIYGAKWCGACREAERYLKRKGISVLEKDVDQSDQVQAELRAKLTRARLPPTSSIPVIDIGGKILVGFSQAAVDAALKSVGR